MSGHFITLAVKSIRSAFSFPVRLFSFWLMFFAAFRLWFVLWLHSKWDPSAPQRVWASFWHALPLDLSMAAYFCLLPVLGWTITVLIGPAAYKAYNRIVLIFNILLLLLSVGLFGANVFLYEEWHTLLNRRALAYLSDPAALLDSMSGIFVLASILLFLGACWALFALYKRWTGDAFPVAGRFSRLLALWLPLQLTLLLLALRGTGVMPVNESAVYYSPHLFDNHAATNTGWHLMHSLIETESTQNHYRFDDPVRVKTAVDSLFQAVPAAEKTPLLQGAEKPNVVLIIMESMTAQVVEELGGEKGICPNLSALIREGLLFDRCYGSGYRTDQGLVSVLAGYPAQPDQSVVLLSDKAEKLPTLTRSFKENGFSTLYVYGGELTFANIGVWLRGQSFDRVLSESDFPATAITQRWGADDGHMLQRFCMEINQLQEPFFATGMTLSLHTPYDVPFESRWKAPGDPAMFRHSAAFADDAIGRFFEQARQQSWYQNTLFVLVADHGHSMPGALGMDQAAARQVPLVFCGPRLSEAWRGKRIPGVGNHHDIAATLLDNLPGVRAEKLRWSRDLLAGQRPEAPVNGGWAYYTNENGLGWILPGAAAFYEFESGQWRDGQGQLGAQDRWIARAYLQALYDDFLGL